jgi:hypothetical protein
MMRRLAPEDFGGGGGGGGWGCGCGDGLSRCGPASGPYGELGARAAVARLPSPSLGPVPAASLTSPYYAFMDRAHGAAPRSSVVSLPCSTSGILAAWWPAGPGQVKQPAMQASPCLRLRRRRRQSVRHLPHLATSRGFVRWHIAAVDAAHPPTRGAQWAVESRRHTGRGLSAPARRSTAPCPPHAPAAATFPRITALDA